MNEPSRDYEPDLATDLAALLARVDARWRHEVMTVVIDQAAARQQSDAAADKARIKRLANVLKILPVDVHADLTQLLSDIKSPRRAGQFSTFTSVAFEYEGRYVHGEVAGPARGNPPAHRIWIPGEPSNLHIPVSALRHGRPMPNIETTRGWVQSPQSAQERLIETSAQLRAGAPSDQRIGLLRDQQVLRTTLASWHGVPTEVLAGRLAARVFDLAGVLRRSGPETWQMIMRAVQDARGLPPLPGPHQDAQVQRVQDIFAATPRAVHADLQQLLDDARRPRLEGVFEQGHVVAFERSGRRVQGVVDGPTRGDPPTCNVWTPGGQRLRIPASELSHGIPMPHIEVGTEVIITPQDAERGLLDRMVKMVFEARRGQEFTDSVVKDAEAIRDALANWHGISPDALINQIGPKFQQISAERIARGCLLRPVRMDFPGPQRITRNNRRDPPPRRPPSRPTKRNNRR